MWPDKQEYDTCNELCLDIYKDDVKSPWADVHTFWLFPIWQTRVVIMLNNGQSRFGDVMTLHHAAPT